MGYTQPAVSHILKTMGDEIGFSLFVGTKQSVFLTPNAKAILPFVWNLLAVNEQLEQTINALNGRPSDDCRLRKHLLKLAAPDHPRL